MARMTARMARINDQAIVLGCNLFISAFPNPCPSSSSSLPFILAIL